MYQTKLLLLLFESLTKLATLYLCRNYIIFLAPKLYISIDNYLFLKQMSNNNRTGTFQFRIYFLLHIFFVKTLILSTKNLDRFLIYSQVCSGKKSYTLFTNIEKRVTSVRYLIIKVFLLLRRVTNTDTII